QTASRVWLLSDDDLSIKRHSSCTTIAFIDAIGGSLVGFKTDHYYLGRSGSEGRVVNLNLCARFLSGKCAGISDRMTRNGCEANRQRANGARAIGEPDKSGRSDRRIDRKAAAVVINMDRISNRRDRRKRLTRGDFDSANRDARIRRQFTNRVCAGWN